MIVEIHFQEGFSNEKVQLLVDEAVVDEFSLNTRLQTGLAAIRKLDINPGTKVQVVLPDHGIRQQIPADGTHRYVKVNLEEGRVVASPTDQMPGYL